MTTPRAHVALQHPNGEPAALLTPAAACSGPPRQGQHQAADTPTTEPNVEHSPFDTNHLGHQAVELERYAMANKVWQTKVKRLRLPDLLCVRCGRRVESKGKSQLGVVLSHSDAPNRAWDDGGMRDADLFAFVRVDLTIVPPRVSTPLYLRTDALRAARSHARESNRKAISEGAEVTLEWQGWVPSKSGVVRGLDDDGRIVCDYDDGRTYRYAHWRNWPSRYAYVKAGDSFRANETMVAGVVAAPTDLPCPGSVWDVERALRSDDAGDRYAAARTAGILGRDDLVPVLVEIAESGAVDWRVRLEALASLARLDPGSWTPHIADLALDKDSSGDHRMECVFVLSEIPTNEAKLALAQVADLGDDHPLELRAAAVWGLGQGVDPRPDLVLPFAAADNDFVALHAIAALDALPDSLAHTASEWITTGDDRRAAVGAQILLRHNAIEHLLEIVNANGPGRIWALRALGDVAPDVVTAYGPERVGADVVNDLAPLWIAQRDWLRRSGAQGLSALDVQKVRFNPLVADD